MHDHTLHKILEEVFAFNGMDYDIDLIRSNSRKAEIVVMKKMACIALKNSGMSYHKVGAFLNMDHCAVIHHVLHSKWMRGYDIVFPHSDYNAVLQQIDFYQDKINILRAKLKTIKRVTTPIKIGESRV